MRGDCWDQKMCYERGSVRPVNSIDTAAHRLCTETGCAVWGCELSQGRTKTPPGPGAATGEVSASGELHLPSGPNPLKKLLEEEGGTAREEKVEEQ